MPSHLRPIAFVAMPFRTRDVPRDWRNAPRKVDFDRLWEHAIRPALEQLGYLAIRADSEVGTVIVKDMLERLALADLVVADVTLPNGNVYYETGIRHVAKKTHCVLVAADWSKQLFDIDQMRTHRYPLEVGTVPKAEAKAIKKNVKKAVKSTCDSPTPYYEFVGDRSRSTVFRKQAKRIHQFQVQVGGIQRERKEKRKAKKVRQLVASAGAKGLAIPEVALELLTLVRDSLDWEEFQRFVARLPQHLRERPFTREQEFLAKSKLGNHHEAIAGLEQLIELQGETAERLGLIGGRYKKLWREERDTREERGVSDPGPDELAYLQGAIEHYDRGRLLDFNEYFCACNLPLLLRVRDRQADRDRPSDRQEATILDDIVVRTCNRRIELGEEDGWEYPTLLGTAFRAGDVEEAERLATRVAMEGPAKWKLQSTLDDLRDAVRGSIDPHPELEDILRRFEQLA